MSELRDILEQAASDLDIYKNHEPAEAREWLNKLLKAAHLGYPGDDRIDYIRFRNGRVIVGTSYSVRGCAQDDEFEFPEHVLDDEDPIDAISAWAWGERVAEAGRRVKSAEDDLASAKAELATALAS